MASEKKHVPMGVTPRIAGELRNFAKAKHTTIFLKPEDDSSVLNLKGFIIGPEDSPFHGGFFFFDFNLIKFPQEPPKTKFTTPTSNERMHPNLYACFSPDTEILLSDGKVDNIGNIVKKYDQGDRSQFVIGDDGESKAIIGTTPLTNAQMFKVEQTNGCTYYVNEGHILVLKASGLSPYVQNKKCFYHVYCNKVNEFNKYSRNKCMGCSGIKSLCTTYLSNEDAIVACNELKNGNDFYVKHSRDQIILDNDVLEMTIKDWMSEWCSNKGKERLYGFKVNRPIYQKFTEDFGTYLPPYMLGIWLGDGNHSRAQIWSRDIEIIKYLEQFCENKHLNFSCKWQDEDAEHFQEYNYENIESYSNRIGCFNIYLSINDNSTRNPFVEELKRMNIYKNKHIPSQYLNSDEKSRLELLAGLLDTDGCLKKDNRYNSLRYVFTQTDVHKHLVLQVKELCESLGIKVTRPYKEIKKPPFKGEKFSNGSATRFHWVISIGGEKIKNIPCLIPRKQWVNKSSEVSFYNTYSRLNITKTKDKDKFTAIEVEGGKFLLPDFTVVHNCGRVCLSLLNTWGPNEWSPVITFEKILLTIQGILDSNPISHEPSYSKTPVNNQQAIDYAVISRWLSLTTVERWLKSGHQQFDEEMKQYFVENIKVYKDSIDKLRPYDKKTLTSFHNLSVRVDVETLERKLEHHYKTLSKTLKK